MNVSTVFNKYNSYCVYSKFSGKEWGTARVGDFRSLEINPGFLFVHYGQSIFEGGIAFRWPNSKIVPFRLADYVQRLNHSAQRMLIPKIDEQFAIRAITKYLKVLAEDTKDDITYLRPIIFASDFTNLGLKVSRTYTFCVLSCSINSKFRNLDEEILLSTVARAYPGGTGSIKSPGNYGPILGIKAEAQKQGYSNVLFPDTTGKYIEEAIGNNIFVVMTDKRVFTPTTKTGTVLAGITRDSVIQLLRDEQFDVFDSDNIEISKMLNWYFSGQIAEVFLTGTALGISSVKSLTIEGKKLLFESKPNLALEIRRNLTGIQTGKIEDKFNWMN